MLACPRSIHPTNQRPARHRRTSIASLHFPGVYTYAFTGLLSQYKADNLSFFVACDFVASFPQQRFARPYPSYHLQLACQYGMSDNKPWLSQPLVTPHHLLEMILATNTIRSMELVSPKLKGHSDPPRCMFNNHKPAHLPHLPLAVPCRRSHQATESNITENHQPDSHPAPRRIDP